MPGQLSELLKTSVNNVALQKRPCDYIFITYLPAQVRPGAPEPIRAARFRLEGACCRTEPSSLTKEH